MVMRVPGVLPGLVWAVVLGVVSLPEPVGADVLRERSAASQLAAAAETDEAVVARRLQNVERLLHVSSGARRVLASDNELAKKIRDHALLRLEQAGKAFDEGDLVAANRLLDEASKTLFQAVRMLGTATATVDKKKRDFEARVESVQILLDALRRIAGEEGSQKAAEKTAAGVERAVAEARALADQGQHDEGRKRLDEGYEAAKLAVEKLRDGDTLVRTLEFETPEEEYRYELDRNDTHQMLVKVLMQEKKTGEQMQQKIDEFVARAKELRGQAEREAAEGMFEQATRTLESATKELVRAIRAGGIYIPG